MSADGRSPLGRLAARHGVEASYEDAWGRLREVSEETLVAVLQALGAPVSSAREAAGVLGGETATAAGSLSLPPVVVAWDGRLPPVPIGPADASRAVGLALALEDGGEAGELLSVEVRDGSATVVAAGALPFGVHELAVASTPGGLGRAGATRKEEPEEITVISAPSRPPAVGPRDWGLFAPAYGLFGEGLEPASFTTLERLGVLAGRRGAAYVATLPLLAEPSRADEPGGRPAPYGPLSRMWWNEGYLDPARDPELAELAGRLGVRAPAGGVDVGARAAALRPALAAALGRLGEHGGERLGRYEQFLADRPDVLAYAQFRAARELEGGDWSRWPVSWRHGLVDERALPPDAVAAHLYAQFACEEQVAAMAGALGENGSGLLFDLPVGCRPDGFDTWAFPGSFATGASIGAPPDGFFRAGQDWGFRPLHPEGERRSGYEVTRGALSHLLRHAAACRLDHAMGLSRLWWIPAGAEPGEGAYVRYRLEETLAVCCLEAWRHGAALVGEDLGTVEASLTEALAAHGVAGMHVAVFDLESEAAHPMEPLSPRPGSAAYVDTHDTATFAGWFTGADLELRRRLGLLGDDLGPLSARRRDARMTLVDRLVASDLLREAEADEPAAVHEALAGELAASAAGLVLVNLEDCFGELDPQNVPGTTGEHANFCRPLARSLQEIERDGRVESTLRRVDRTRRQADLGAAAR